MAPHEELRRSHARLHVLTEVSRSFSLVATDYHALLTRIAHTVADVLGDGGSVSRGATFSFTLASR